MTSSYRVKLSLIFLLAITARVMPLYSVPGLIDHNLMSFSSWYVDSARSHLSRALPALVHRSLSPLEINANQTLQWEREQEAAQTAMDFRSNKRKKTYGF